MKNNINLNILVFIGFLAFVISSCTSQKQIAYFQKGVNQSDTISVADAYVPKIQPGDILAIPVSSLNPAASSFFNPYSSAPATASADPAAINPAPSLSSSNGYLVDAEGAIDFPLLGSIKVGGLTTSEARDTIKNKLKSTYLKEPTVSVRLLNYKISIMGEVSRPSVYVIPNEKVTLPEALTMAGDLTIYAKRDNILIVRDNGGKKEFGRVNLNNRDVFTSPYYYLHSGDLIYVEQGKAKAAQTDQAYRILPILLSALTVIGILIYRFK
ncbi:polysaccharide export protein [Mucilaginibacter conchicola]|uniref:Polysaccharide export protein n=1 Tax=Mucilaginibacter conchicola TaxID=2303333 RepID=A0A372NZ47_9SPHI|nr:polysaccharide biosynthesis/export family protein [Mucilaginibacter conchicola]RFZ95380.1 polysaccharide export protein [Mucilaginibacter conchicola]